MISIDECISIFYEIQTKLFDIRWRRGTMNPAYKNVSLSQVNEKHFRLDNSSYKNKLMYNE